MSLLEKFDSMCKDLHIRSDKSGPHHDAMRERKAGFRSDIKMINYAFIRTSVLADIYLFCVQQMDDVYLFLSEQVF